MLKVSLYNNITIIIGIFLELVADLDVKKTMWNEAVKLFNDIETQLQVFRSVLEAAFEQDTQVEYDIIINNYCN